MDPTQSINSELIFAEAMRDYKRKHGLTGKEKVGDIVLQDTQTDQIIDIIDRFYKKEKDPVKGNRE